MKDLDNDTFLELLQCNKKILREAYINYMEAVTMANPYIFMEVERMNAYAWKQIPKEKREDFYKLANDVIRELGIDKKWEELIEQERIAKEQERYAKVQERIAKERALEGERLFKEENELLRKRIKELEAQTNKL